MSIPGYTGTLTVDGVTHCAFAYTFDEEMALNPSTTFCNEGDTNYTRGLKTYTGTISSPTRISGDTGTLVMSNSNVGSVSISAEVFFNSRNMVNDVAENVVYDHGYTVQGTPTIA